MDEKRKLAYELLLPYFIDPAICGIQNGLCSYYTPDGRTCIAGKCMIDPQKFANSSDPIRKIIEIYGQIGTFKPDIVDKFTNDEWRGLQNIHDAIATTALIYDNSIFNTKEFKMYCVENNHTIYHSVKFYEDC